MLTFPPAFSAPYEARQPLVQPEGPSSGAPGAKPPRHKASLIRVSDVLCHICGRLRGRDFLMDPLCFFQGRYKTAPLCKYCTSYSVAYIFF